MLELLKKLNDMLTASILAELGLFGVSQDIVKVYDRQTGSASGKVAIELENKAFKLPRDNKEIKKNLKLHEKGKGKKGPLKSTF